MPLSQTLDRAGLQIATLKLVQIPRKQESSKIRGQCLTPGFLLLHRGAGSAWSQESWSPESREDSGSARGCLSQCVVSQTAAQ